MSFILLTQGFYCKNNGLNGNELRDFVCLYTLADLRYKKMEQKDKIFISGQNGKEMMLTCERDYTYIINTKHK